MQNLEKIDTFLNNHHLMSLSTCRDGAINACSLFYAYSAVDKCFIVASSDDTNHIKDIKYNQNVAGTIALDTSKVSIIQGVQFRGIFFLLEDDNLKKLYFEKFPYAIAMKPKLWCIKATYFKMTDNRFGFGKKLIWQQT